MIVNSTLILCAGVQNFLSLALLPLQHILTNASQKVNKGIKSPDKTLKEKCVYSLSAQRASRQVTSLPQVWTEQRGGVSDGRMNKSTPDRAVCSVDLEQQMNGCLSLRNFFACLNWPFMTCLVRCSKFHGQSQSTLLRQRKAVIPNLVPEALQHCKLNAHLPYSAHYSRGSMTESGCVK